MKLSRFLYPALALVAIAGAAAGAVYVYNTRPLPVEIARPEKNVAIEVFGLGTVEARIVSTIGFEVAATLAELAADHGDAVKRGTVLARLDSAEQEARVVRAEANLHAADAALTRAQTTVGRQAAVLAQKDEVNRRQQELVRKNVVSIEKAEEADKELRVAQADHAVAIADVAVARAALEIASADHRREKILLEKYTLRAPFDGVVVERHRELGAAVKAGDPVFTLADPASIWALAYVEESRSGAIAEGQPAVVHLRSLPGSAMAARVVRIGIESDRVSEERRIWVKCEQCPPAFHLGEQAEVVITTSVVPEAVLVPETAVTGFDGFRGDVWLAEDGAARRATLTFGHRTLDGRLTVAGGLPAGAGIIVRSDGGLREGRAVTAGGNLAP